MSKTQKEPAPALVADDPRALDLIGDAADGLARAIQHHLPPGTTEVLGSAQAEIFLKAKQLENLINPRRLKPKAGNRRAFDRDPNRFPYDVVVDLTTVRDSFDNLLIVFGWRTIASEPAIAPHSPAGFVYWPKKDVNRRDVDMMLKAASRLKQAAEASHLTVTNDNEPPPAFHILPEPKRVSGSVAAHALETAADFMEVICRANAPDDFGVELTPAGESITRYNYAKTPRGKEELHNYRVQQRHGYNVNTPKRERSPGGGVYDKTERIRQMALELANEAEQCGLREMGKELAAELREWAWNGFRLIYPTDASATWDSIVPEGQLEKWYFEFSKDGSIRDKLLRLKLAAEKKLLASMSAVTEKSRRMTAALPPVELIEVSKIDAALQTRLDSLASLSQIGAATIGRFINTMCRYSDVRDAAIAIHNQLNGESPSAQRLDLIEKAIDDAQQAWDEFHACIMPLIQFAESRNLSTPALVKLHQVTDGKSSPEIDAVSDDIGRIIAEIERSGRQPITQPVSPRESVSFPPGEFVDPATGERFDFDGRKLLLDLWKAIWEARRKLEYSDLYDGRIEKWQGDDNINTEGAIKTALSELRQYFRTRKRSDFADAIRHRNKIIWLERSSLKKKHI